MKQLEKERQLAIETQNTALSEEKKENEYKKVPEKSEVKWKPDKSQVLTIKEALRKNKKEEKK